MNYHKFSRKRPQKYNYFCEMQILFENMGEYLKQPNS